MLTEYVKRLKVKYHLFEAFTVESEGILQLSDIEHCLLLEHSIESFMKGETTMEYDPESGTFIFHTKPTLMNPDCPNCQAELYAGIPIEKINDNHLGVGKCEYTPEQRKLYDEWWMKNDRVLHRHN